MTSLLPDPWSIVDTDNETFDITSVCSTIDEMLYDVSLKACQAQVTRSDVVCVNR